ncbi:MAG: CDP-alcohol phosphatidyltransferase family protein [Clostridium sp.]|nr:CDP-alcohol phosphatidyltransferase family protein [Clostridium sp.]MCM1444477.1 CDP-alcohol phosphatidyltransferase family protein [Candidatus Amulumruptor caecigallinarius]
MSNYKEMIKQALKELKNKKTFYKQIPNLLTLSRILAPFIILPLAITENIIPSIIVSSIIASTDLFDGMLARKFNSTSSLGKELDALSDKVFALSLTIPLLLTNPIFSLNIILEGSIGITNLIAKLKNKNPHTELIGKVKTFFLFGSIIMGYINLFVPLNMGLFIGMITSTAMIQGVTLATYINKNFIKQKNTNKNIINELENIKIKNVNKLESNKDLYYTNSKTLKKQSINSKNGVKKLVLKKYK